jgi:hypothetical protein
MDIASLATAAMTLLTPYLTKAAEKFSEKAGEDLWSKVKNVFTKDEEKELVRKVEENEITKSDLVNIENSLIERLRNESNFEQLIRTSLNITPATEFILEQDIESTVKIREKLKKLYSAQINAGIATEGDIKNRIDMLEEMLMDKDKKIRSTICKMK